MSLREMNGSTADARINLASAASALHRSRPMNKQKKERRLRLFGGGKTDREGGGMPLPSMVSQMLNHIQDNGPTPIPDLVSMVENLHYKRERLEYIYHKGHNLEGDAYVLFIDDLIGEMEEAGVVVRHGACLKLGPKFTLGSPLPLPDGMGATIYAKPVRDVIGQASMHDLEIKSLAHDLLPERPGLRPINDSNVQRLADSMRAFGYMPEHPVLMDQHSRVLSGRHRIKAAAAAGVQYVTRTIDVASDLEALAIAFTANEGSTFTRLERERIAKRLSAAGVSIDHIGQVIGRAGKRQLIEAKLLADPERSDRAIAKDIGVSHHTVATVRSELESGGQIAHLEKPRTGHDNKSYPVRKSQAANSTGAHLARLVNQAGPKGLTVEEAREKLAAAGIKTNPQTVNSALNNLARSGQVMPTGEKRKATERGGRPATAYVAVKDQPSRPAPTDKYDAIVEHILKLASDLPQHYRDYIIRQWNQK